jgi:hypothetical protein
MFRTLGAAGVGAALLALAAMPAQAVTMFQATLTGDQEVPTPVATDAFGTATLTLNDAQTRLEISIQLFGLDLDGMQTPDPNDDIVGLHIHAAPFGVNGSVVFGFLHPFSDLNGDLTVDAAAGTVFSGWDLNEGNGTTLDAQLPALFAQGLYINAHTPVNPGGEIRGQVVGVPVPGTIALLAAAVLGLAAGGRRRGRRRAAAA